MKLTKKQILKELWAKYQWKDLGFSFNELLNRFTCKQLLEYLKIERGLEC